MPTITVTEVAGFAHCRNPRCAGGNQEAVKALRQTDAFSYSERGGDLPGIEASNDYVRFANPEDAPCPHCGEGREITEQARPSYQSFGHGPQDALLEIEVGPNGSRFDPSKQAELQAQDRDKLQAEVSELRGAISVLLAQQGQQPPQEATE